MGFYNLLTNRVAVVRKFDSMIFDATISENHTSELEVTDSPIETGQSISDHAFMKPLTLKISASVSDVVLNPFKRFGSGLTFSGSTKRSKKAFEMLQELQAKAEPFDIQTGLKLYKNMVISRLSATQDKDSGQILNVDIDVREVIIVSTATVTYPSRAKAKQAQKTKNKGTQQAGEVAKTDPKQKSLATQLNNSTGNRLGLKQ